MLSAFSLRPACNLLAYTGYPDLYFCISLERSMSCSWNSMCPPRTDLDKQTNKQTHEKTNKNKTKQTKNKQTNQTLKEIMTYFL